jgi:hypothetical protein
MGLRFSNGKFFMIDALDSNSFACAYWPNMKAEDGDLVFGIVLDLGIQNLQSSLQRSAASTRS